MQGYGIIWVSAMPESLPSKRLRNVSWKSCEYAMEPEVRDQAELAEKLASGMIPEPEKQKIRRNGCTEKAVRMGTGIPYQKAAVRNLLTICI